jgi:16S rRNA (cytosine967-C5)-methyltransferase
LIDTFSSRAKALDPEVRQILRIGVYELVMLRRPGHSAVFASVEQAKRFAKPGVDRFVNGILRTVERRLDDLPQPSTDDPVVDAAIRCSHPDWMASRWADRYGLENAERLMAYNNRRPVYSLRINSLKTSEEAFKQQLDGLGVAWTDSPYLAGFVRVKRLQAVIGAGLLASGLAAVQDESAGLVSRVLDPKPGEYIIDGCAAPGGKLIHAGILMGNEGRLVGIDSNRKRLASALRSANSHGLGIVEIHAGDLAEMEPSDSLPRADAVLLDAPCSGLGVLSRRADLRWQRKEESLDELTVLQDRLLDAAASFVRPEGRLVYATCTIEPEENQERITAFLGRHSDFVLERLSDSIPQDLSDERFLASLPHVHGIDGAFAACLVRRSP